MSYDYSEDLAGMPRQLDQLRDALNKGDWDGAIDILIVHAKCVDRIGAWITLQRLTDIAGLNNDGTPKLPRPPAE